MMKTKEMQNLTLENLLVFLQGLKLVTIFAVWDNWSTSTKR